MSRAVINLAKLSHLSTRTRYRLLFTCFLLTTAHLLFSASLIRWSANLSKPPAHADPRSTSKTSSNVSSKGHLPPYGAQDADRPVVPQAKLLKDFFRWNEADIAFLSPPVFLPPTPPSPPITDPFPLLSSNLPPRNLRKLLQPPEINRPSHFRHLRPSHSSQVELTQQPSRSYFSRFGSKSFGRRPDPSPYPPYHSKLNPTGMAPLLIGLTRNWPLLLQCVSSYIAAGWPAEEIFVVENTGTMDANERELLTLQNPFFMNRTQLEMLGVKVVSTPTLLTFSQLQNFFAWTALQRGWTEYFWAHQDLMVFSYEHRHPSYSPAAAAARAKAQSKSNKSKAKANAKTSSTSSKTVEDDEPEEYRSLYANALHVLQKYRDPSHPKWAHHFFSYDHLTLVHRGRHPLRWGWDTQIPFYGTDCDMYTRLMWAGYAQNESTTPSTRVGHILDVSAVLEDIGALFRIPGIKASFPGDPHPHARNQNVKVKPGSAAAATAKTEAETYANLLSTARRMQRAKYALGNGHEGATRAGRRSSREGKESRSIGTPRGSRPAWRCGSRQDEQYFRRNGDIEDVISRGSGRLGRTRGMEMG
ncbi:unnamed protein product [Sordaria macrospora k-hell]|uniref:WGS project CABT00000000 data, contig 2.53 n=1 Tax=Sordaria macrospora (strain ATCC MYA-333 / DSM 997 / K(L3346) / K-hell) TaxID=771870 RepID=F7W9N9_SORMK|nr:uncharacterized protein SMAC_08197 [Sordaria macrospora k-hell]CCC14030.1 unnamed protein product [Sordaria macrospora k-hell]